MSNRDMEGGVLFQNNKRRTENQPHFRGEIRVSPAVIESLVDQMSKGVRFPKLEVAGWQKITNSGDQFMSLKASPLYNGGQQGSRSTSQNGNGNWPSPQQPQAPQFQQPQFPSVPPVSSSAMDDEIPFDGTGQT
jgi:uncharacterized protein (DUF736 family)